ncbi:putative NAD(P)H quinone oxidoreductase, PIG3 family [Pseudonocardia thermophila]|uniref:Putative NAD(P)H quinone oxidoreductase, PIG3 family n=2 Tax=Pseudonocardia thermophila TaxID=1848 RepID=A0A1M7BA76_PSETH|nr:putative NAD(P)H quinone oxidoreductase, PIG3 family [Pseudonocardia thermophila]
MRAVEITGGGGGPEVLKPAERPVPQPGPGEVQIAVAAAGVNGHDLHHRRHGSHPLLPGESDLPGLEVSGTVAAVGPGVTRWSVGEPVVALLRGGGYAEYVVAPAGLCLPVPTGLTMVEAAAMPETTFTVWSNVFADGWLRPGRRMLVNSGTSGIGVTAIQLASALGVEVYATAGGADRCAACVDLGARAAIDYRSEDFAQRLPELAGGVDLIVELVGGDYLDKDVQLLAPDGRLVLIGLARGPRAEIDFATVAAKRLTITGSLLRPRPPAYKEEIARDVERIVWPLVEAGRVRPVLHAVVPLDDAAEAHRILEARGHVGKVVLQVGAR